MLTPLQQHTAAQQWSGEERRTCEWHPHAHRSCQLRRTGAPQSYTSSPSSPPLTGGRGWRSHTRKPLPACLRLRSPLRSRPWRPCRQCRCHLCGKHWHMCDWVINTQKRHAEVDGCVGERAGGCAGVRLGGCAGAGRAGGAGQHQPVVPAAAAAPGSVVHKNTDGGRQGVSPSGQAEGKQ